MLSFKPTFSLLFFTFIKRLFSSFSLSAISEKGKEGNLHMLTTFSAPSIKLLILPQTIFCKPCEVGIILILPLRKVRLSDGTSCRTSLQHVLSCHQCCSYGHLRSWFNSQKPWLRELWHLLSLRKHPIDDTVRRSSVLSKAFVQRSKSFPRFHKVPILELSSYSPPHLCPEALFLSLTTDGLGFQFSRLHRTTFCFLDLPKSFLSYKERLIPNQWP